MDAMDEIDFSKIGLKMKQLRTEQGVTQEKVAKDLDCTAAFVSNLENNRTKLNLRVLLYYAKLCNVSVDTLIHAGEGAHANAASSEQRNHELLDIFQTFTPEEQEKIIEMLKIWKSKP